MSVISDSAAHTEVNESLQSETYSNMIEWISSDDECDDIYMPLCWCLFIYRDGRHSGV